LHAEELEPLAETRAEFGGHHGCTCPITCTGRTGRVGVAITDNVRFLPFEQ
jgi:hypothetical protein